MEDTTVYYRVYLPFEIIPFKIKLALLVSKLRRKSQIIPIIRHTKIGQVHNSFWTRNSDFKSIQFRKTTPRLRCTRASRGLKVTTSYHPLRKPQLCLVVSSYESHECTCVSPFLGASPDTWPTNFNSQVLHGHECLTL